MPENAGAEEPCSECRHPIALHGDTSGCETCSCPFYKSDLLPMTPEQIAEVRAQRSTRA